LRSLKYFALGWVKPRAKDLQRQGEIFLMKVCRAGSTLKIETLLLTFRVLKSKK